MKSLFEEFVNNYNALGKEEKVKFWDEFNSQPETGPLAKDLIESWSMVPVNEDERYFLVVTDRESGEEYISEGQTYDSVIQVYKILQTPQTDGFYLKVPCVPKFNNKDESSLKELYNRTLILHSRNIHLYNIEVYEQTEESLPKRYGN